MAQESSFSSNGGRRRIFKGDLLGLLVVSCLLLFAWSVAVPIFEAPDEPMHWDVARYIHDHSRLPVYASDMVEGNQPPLYYLLIAPVSGGTSQPTPRPGVLTHGIPMNACPPRAFKDCPSDLRKFLSIRFARLITAFISLTTVLFIYLAAFEATYSRYTGLLAGGLTAFLPQFTFRGMNISNDALVTMTCAIVTYLLIRLLRRGFSWRVGWAACICVSLAMLSKVSAIICFPVLAVVLVAGARRWGERALRLCMIPCGLLLTVPWLARNQILYGDLLAAGKSMLSTVPFLVEKKSIWSSYFLDPFPRMLAQSFVGVFGWMEIYLPTWFYTIFAILGIAGFAAIFYGLAIRKVDPRIVVTLGALLLLAIASVVQLNLTFTQPQGRYLFPALSSIMLLLTLGLESLPYWNQRATFATLILFAGLNLYALFRIEMPPYWDRVNFPALEVVDTFVIPSPKSGGAAGPLSPDGRFGQTFRASNSGLSTVEFQVATYGKKAPSGVVTLHLKHDPKDVQDIAKTSFPAKNVADCSFLKLTFPPLPDSRNKSYYAFLDIQGIPAAYPITVFVSNHDIYNGGQFFRNDEATSQDMCFRVSETAGGAACNDCSPSRVEIAIGNRK